MTKPTALWRRVLLTRAALKEDPHNTKKQLTLRQAQDKYDASRMNYQTDNEFMQHLAQRD